MTWTTVKKYSTFKEADAYRNQLLGEQDGMKIKVKKYGGKNEKPLRFEVKVGKENS